MIRANPGWTAYFTQEHGQHSTKPVEAWDNSGAAMVVDSKRGGLRRAADYTNFREVARDDGVTAIAAVPGGGWEFEYTNDDGTTFRDPVVAWAIDSTGWGHPLAADHTGFAYPEEGDNAHLIPPGDQGNAESPTA